jgi:hypothetical protein
MGKLLVAILVTGLALSAHAQIGSNFEQCKVHYGTPTDIVKNTTGGIVKCSFLNPNPDNFSRNYYIYTRFADGACDSVMYSIKGNGHAISSYEANLLLTENANGYIWSRTGTTSQGGTELSAHMDGKVAMVAHFAPWKWLWVETVEAARDD